MRIGPEEVANLLGHWAKCIGLGELHRNDLDGH
jgi:hypothetical protein